MSRKSTNQQPSKCSQPQTHIDTHTHTYIHTYIHTLACIHTNSSRIPHIFLIRHAWGKQISDGLLQAVKEMEEEEQNLGDFGKS